MQHFTDLISIDSLQITSQPQGLPISEAELMSQNNQSSTVIASSTTQTSCPYDHLVDDLRKEIQKIAPTIKDPIQQAVYQCLERVVPNVPVQQTGLVLEEEEARLEPDIDIEDVTRNTENIPHGSNLDSDSSLIKKPTQKRFFGRSTVTYTETKTLFGTLYCRSTVYEDRGVCCTENFYMAHPANWLVSLGIKRSFDVLFASSTQGWKNNLSSRSFRAVPKDALIFQFCEDGNLEGVKTLLSRGDASLWDRTPWGETLLHVSINFSCFF